MKPTQIIDLFANIKATFVSFFSILMFVTLGVAVFLGISWAAPALQNAADNMFDQGSFHHFQIQYSCGLTDDDLEKLAETEGISEVEAERQSFETLRTGGHKYTVKVQSLGQSIDTPTIVEGELPTKSGEMAFHAESAKELGVNVGDTITFETDVSADDQDALLRHSFTVTALVNNAEYVAELSGTYGYSTSPSGTVDGIAWVVDDVFNASAFQDGYPIVNVRCNSLAGIGTFSNEYKRASNEIKQTLESLGDTLATKRYEDLHGQAQEKIDGAKKDIADGEKKTKDGEGEIEQAKRDITNGERRVANGESELANGYAEITDGERKLSEAQSQYDMETAQARKELDSKKSELDQAQQEYDSALAGLNDLKAQYEQTQQLPDSPEKQAMLEKLKAEIDKMEPQVVAMKAQLDEGWQLYYAAEAEFDKQAAESRQKLNEAESQLSGARSQVAQGETELADIKQQLGSAKQELAGGEKDLAQAKEELVQAKEELGGAEEKLVDMAKYNWSVMPRSYNGGAGEISMFSDVTNNLSISMAALFIIVGLLVSYFAVSRIVLEQMTQIGTKKALGFRRGEITISYLSYSSMAVVAGSILGSFVAYFIVERIIGSVLADMFVFGTYPAYFGWELFLVIFAVELVLVLGSTYLGCRKILKKHAIDLLRGPEPPAVKARFYEKWGVWERLPLFIQTIVNNCVNDKRRVLNTIVGVAGCTALIVTAITLNNNVMKSYYHQYEEVYGFNSIAYVESEPEGAVENLESALEREGASTAQVLTQKRLIEQPNGENGSMSIIVPVDEDSFNRIYHIHPTTDGTLDLSADGVWVSQAYAVHFNAKVGDIITIDGGDGTKHEVPILGFYEFWLTKHEMIMGKGYYEREFEDVAPNAILAQTGKLAIDDLEATIVSVEGFDSIVDDATRQKSDFDTFSSVSGAVVFIYLVLAALMAVVVLLNLNVMVIHEKKRELLVLMINGYRVKDARHYVSYDSILLTTLGIIVGLVLGCVMGAVTVASVEPVTGVFIKSVDAWAVAIGIVGSAALAVIMSQIALRRVNKFKLTDINKF